MVRQRILVFLALGACAPEAPASGDRSGDAVAVRVRPVEVANLARPVRATGRLGYAEEIRLAFKVGGLVASVHVEQGARVERGQLLARLDPREIDAALSQARSARSKARRDLRRTRRLHRDSVVTRETLQNAVTAASVSRAGEAAARFNRRTAEIRAPAAGVVLSRSVEPGEVVAPGTPILMIGVATHQGGARGGRVVRVGLADRDVARLAVGDPAQVELDALPGLSLPGRVSEVAPSASPGTGLVAVEIELEGDDAAPLASGLVVRASIQPRADERHVVIPLAALIEADGVNAHVFAVSADRRRAQRRAVVIAFLAGDRVAIASGLTGVGEVVTEGAAYLATDSAIKVVTDEPVGPEAPLDGEAGASAPIGEGIASPAVEAAPSPAEGASAPAGEGIASPAVEAAPSPAGEGASAPGEGASAPGGAP